MRPVPFVSMMCTCIRCSTFYGTQCSYMWTFICHKCEQRGNKKEKTRWSLTANRRLICLCWKSAFLEHVCDFELLTSWPQNLISSNQTAAKVNPFCIRSPELDDFRHLMWSTGLPIHRHISVKIVMKIQIPMASVGVVYPVFFINSATKKLILFGVSPPGWCHPGAVRLSQPPLPLVTPLPNTINSFLWSC